jgi:hypothetical protein
MKTAILIALSVLCFASPAIAADGPKKPSVCADYEIQEGRKGKFAVCYDSEKPRTFSTWAIVEVSHPAGGTAKYLLGF